MWWRWGRAARHMIDHVVTLTGYGCTSGGWHPGPSAAAGAAARHRGRRVVPRRGPRCPAHAVPGLCTSGVGGVGQGCNGSSAMGAGAQVVGGTPGPRRRRGGGRGTAADACAPRRGPRCPAHAVPGLCTSGVGGVGQGCNGPSAMGAGAQVVGWHPARPSAAAGAAARRRGRRVCPRRGPSLPSPCRAGVVHLWRWWSGAGVQWIECNGCGCTSGGWHPGPSAAAGGGGAGAAADACAPPRPSLPSPCRAGVVHLWRWWSGAGVQWIECNACGCTSGGWHPGPSAGGGAAARHRHEVMKP